MSASASADFILNRTTFEQENPTQIVNLEVPITSTNNADQPVLFNRDALGMTYQIRGCAWQSITTQLDVTDVTAAGIHLALKIDNATGDAGAAGFAKGVIANNQITWAGAITDTWTFQGTLLQSSTAENFLQVKNAGDTMVARIHATPGMTSVQPQTFDLSGTWVLKEAGQNPIDTVIVWNPNDPFSYHVHNKNTGQLMYNF